MLASLFGAEIDDRYTNAWPALSKAVKRSKQGADGLVECSCCGNRYEWSDIESHHAFYRGEKDAAGVNVFPVCGNTSAIGSCHHWLHLNEQWVRDKRNPVWKSGNTPEVVRRLRRGYGSRPAWSFWDRLLVAMAVLALLGTGLSLLPRSLADYKPAIKIERSR